jgi:hypothetical protein
MPKWLTRDDDIRLETINRAQSLKKTVCYIVIIGNGT